MIGVVLCGGQSTRMGSDKGLLLDGGKTWAQIAGEKLAQLPLPFVLSINRSQTHAYASQVSTYPVVIDDELEIGGPLLGLLSVHHQFQGEDLLVLACDMTNMTVPVLRELLISQKQFPGFEAYVFGDAGSAEPLCGIYTHDGLQSISKAAQERALSRHSMKYVLGLLNTRYFTIDEKLKDAFSNLNSQGDRERFSKTS